MLQTATTGLILSDIFSAASFLSPHTVYIVNPRDGGDSSTIDVSPNVDRGDPLSRRKLG